MIPAVNPPDSAIVAATASACVFGFFFRCSFRCDSFSFEQRISALVSRFDVMLSFDAG